MIELVGVTDGVAVIDVVGVTDIVGDGHGLLFSQSSQSPFVADVIIGSFPEPPKKRTYT